MELELGLALPNSNSIKVDFDLNVPDAVDNAEASCCNTDGCSRGGDDDDRSDEVLVGWPPMRCCSSSRCVKVNMEGMGIGRKVDLSLHNSFHSLFNALYQMFPTQPHGSEQHDQRNYVIKYEHNNNGNWMLAGSMPWETFVRTVKRIKILVRQAY